MEIIGNNDVILEKVKSIIEKEYRDVTFDKALPSFQKDLWEIADEHNTTGPEVLRIYLDWKSMQKE